MTLREGLEKLRDDLSEQLSDPDCVHGAGEYAFQRLDALLSTADSEQREPVAWLGVVDQGMGHWHYEVAEPTASNAFPVYRAITRPGEQREVSMTDQDVWWMIERGTCQWWSGNDGWSHWTTDAKKAVHFCRREDAEAVIAGRDYANPSWRDCYPFVTGHRYMGAGDTREVADLRRKLEETDSTLGNCREGYEAATEAIAELDEELNEANGKLASASLTIATLRTALEAAISDEGLKEHHCVTITCDGQNREPTPSESFEFAQGVMAMAYKVHSTLAAIPADSIAQEVVDVLRLAGGRMRHVLESTSHAMTHAEVQDTRDVLPILDALIARIGGK